MGVEYLHFNIFGLALSDMATNTGSISQRLRDVHINYFYKLQWDRELKYIPDEVKDHFTALKKMFHDDVIDQMNKERESYIASYRHNWNIELTATQVERISNVDTVIRNLHWRRAQKIARLISTIYFRLGYAVKDAERAKYKKL
ncbi:MAG TPA: hypothetical protein VIN07_07370 [Flavipsychrobacter sp.]